MLLDTSTGEVTYTWNQTDNGYTCTASRVCENDSSHSETETVEASMEVTKAPTCEEEGEEVYTAVFTNEAFVTQTQTVKTGALGHHFGDVSYEWTKTDKGYTCTASAVCDVDSSIATETVEAVAEVIKAAHVRKRVKKFIQQYLQIRLLRPRHRRSRLVPLVIYMEKHLTSGRRQIRVIHAQRQEFVRTTTHMLIRKQLLLQWK